MSAAEEEDNLDKRVPVQVTVLTGFLGAGKTTLLNHILTATHGKKDAVRSRSIENEFGDVGIDDELLKKNTAIQAEEELIEMMNGCICCTVRQDLVLVLDNCKLTKRIAAGTLHLDAIVIAPNWHGTPLPLRRPSSSRGTFPSLPASMASSPSLTQSILSSSRRGKAISQVSQKTKGFT